MLFLLAALVGLALGLALGGSLNNLAAIRLRWPVIPLFALIMRDVGVNTPLAYTPWAPLLYVTGLSLLFAWAIWYWNCLPGLLILTSVILLNLILIVANLGHMPVSLALV